MMGDFCHGCLRPLPPGQHCNCPAVRAAWPAALAHFWSEVADGRSVAISVVSDLPPGSEFTLATQKPSPLSARTQAEDAIAAVLEHRELIDRHWRSQPAHKLARRGPRPDWWEGDCTSV